jgi:hypothetical protein
MEREKYVIIGGDAAGMSAAGQIRKLQPKAEIVAYERSPHTSYSACGMPYYIALKPGVSGKEIDGIARRIIADGGYGEYFTHGLGHGLGLEIHENPRLSPLSEDFLQVGDVTTVEPGIYIPGFGGMRIEDDYLITESGAERLSGNLEQGLLLL